MTRRTPRSMVVAVGAVALFTIMLMTPTASAQYRSNGYYPPGEAGRLQHLIDTRNHRNPYDRNVYRKSRHHDPYRNPFRSSRHYQKKVAGSADSYVLRVFRNDGAHGRHSNPRRHLRHHTRHNNHYGYPAGAYGSRARQISPYLRSGSVYELYDCPPPLVIEVPIVQIPPPEPEPPRIDPSQIEYTVIHLVQPEATQRPVTETVVLPDGRTKTIIRSVPIEPPAPDTPTESADASTTTEAVGNDEQNGA